MLSRHGVVNIHRQTAPGAIALTNLGIFRVKPNLLAYISVGPVHNNHLTPAGNWNHREQKEKDYAKS